MPKHNSRKQNKKHSRSLKPRKSQMKKRRTSRRKTSRKSHRKSKNVKRRTKSQSGGTPPKILGLLGSPSSKQEAVKTMAYSTARQTKRLKRIRAAKRRKEGTLWS